MSEKREQLIKEACDLLVDIRKQDNILLSGDGNFYSKNGNLISRYELLCDYHKTNQAVIRATYLLGAIKGMD